MRQIYNSIIIVFEKFCNSGNKKAPHNLYAGADFSVYRASVSEHPVLYALSADRGDVLLGVA